MRAKLYIQGEVCKAELRYTDKESYIIPCHCFKILDGKFEGEEIAVFENSDKFMEWEE